MKVRLMLTCLCDAFYGEVGIATVRVLEHAGCEVEFPADQTCCGQPPYNNGDWTTAKAIAIRCRALFDGPYPIVTPSSSCAAMLREGYKDLFPNEPPLEAYELSEFLLAEAGVTRWPIAGDPRNKPYRTVFHRACHGRALRLGDSPERILRMIGNITLLPLASSEQCCGFGGAFSVTQPALSSEIGTEKLARVHDAKPDLLLSGDMGCLMHLKGLMQRRGMNLRAAHYAEILSEAIG